MRSILLLPALMLFAFPGAGAETAAQLEYRGQEVPDAIALRWLARSAGSNNQSVVSLASTTLRIDSGEASELVTYLAELSGDWVSERDELLQRIGCNATRPWPVGVEAHRIWDLLDQAYAAVDAEFLTLVQSDLGGQGFAQLEKLLSEFKEGMHIQLQPAEVAFAGTHPEYASEVLMTLCEGRI